ncbi:MAG: outer membrane protein, partial [Sphingomicrobium sp.]
MNHTHRALLLATVSVAASSTAVAQAAPSDSVRGINWSGPYIGVQAGVTSVHSKLSGFDENGGDGGGDNDGAWGPLSFPHGNLVGGVYGGYNFRFNNIILGIEGDVNKATGGSSGGNISEDLYPGPGGMFEVSEKWDASIRARLGILATERLLIYGTGGLAWGRFPAYGGQEIDPTDTFYEQNPNWGEGVNIGTGGKRSKMGVTFGGGIEYALGNHWKLRGEYRYADYGSAKYNYIYDPLDVNTPGVVRHKVTTNRFTVGMAYMFGADEGGYDGGVEGSATGTRDWSGFHLGAQIGASSTRSRFSGVDNNQFNGCEGSFCSNIGGGDNVGPWSLIPISHMSLLAGFTAGYDLQFSGIVVGVEGDINLESGSA